MEIILILMLIVFITVLTVTIKQFILLKNEISYLPQEIKQDLQNTHPLVGENIQSIIPEDWSIPLKGTIIQFASASCASCHSAVEQLIEDKKIYKMEHYVFVIPPEDNTKSRDQYKSFIGKYKDLVNILPYSKEVTEKMNITQFPTFIVVDQDGIISIVTVLIKKLNYFLMQKMKIQGDNNEL